MANTAPSDLPPDLEGLHRAMEKKLGLVRALYWAVFGAFFIAAISTSGLIANFAAVAFLGMHLWLAMTIAESAVLMGGSSFAWGGGALVLGPLGMIVLPMLQMSKLRKDKPAADPSLRKRHPRR